MIWRAPPSYRSVGLSQRCGREYFRLSVYSRPHRPRRTQNFTMDRVKIQPKNRTATTNAPYMMHTQYRCAVSLGLILVGTDTKLGVEKLFSLQFETLKTLKVASL